MRLLKPVLLTIFLLALLQCTLQSQDSLFTQPTIATFNSSVKVSGQLNNELKLYNHPFDLTKLEIRDYNDLPCEIESIIENRDPIFLTLFIDANTSDEKLDFFLKTIKELEDSCSLKIETKKFIAKGSEDQTYNEDLFNKYNITSSKVFNDSSISKYIDGLNQNTKSKYQFLLFADSKNETFVDTLTGVASKYKNENNHFGYISYSKDKSPVVAFFGNLYNNTRTFFKTKIFKKPSDEKNFSQLSIHLPIEEIDSNILCSWLNRLSNYYLILTFKYAEYEGVTERRKYRIDYPQDGHLFSNYISVEVPNSNLNLDIISSVEENEYIVSGNPSQVGSDTLSEEEKLNKYLTEGDIYSKEKQYEKALLSYSNYLILKSNPAIEKKSKQTFVQAYSEYYNNTDFDIIYRLGKIYPNYYRSTFRTRYYFYQACYAVKDYSMSLKGFEWLLDHWEKDQNYLNWDDAFIIIERLYTHTFQFDKAIKLDKRFYRNNKIEDALDSFLKNARLKHLVLLADAFPVFMKIMNSSKDLDLLVSNVPKDLQSCINGIYLVNKYSKNIRHIAEYNTISSPNNHELNSIKSYPAIIVDEHYNRAWIVNHYLNELFIIDITLLPINLEEKNLMIDIAENKRSVEPWQELESYESIILQKYCTGILARMISINISNGINNNIDKYLNLVNENSELVYMTRYNRSGNIDQNKTFYLDKAIVDDALWSNSLTTKTYFKQEITYDQNEVIDITNPLFNNISWVGILKVGFAK